MKNCYVVFWAGKQFAIFKTMVAAENTVELLRKFTNSKEEAFRIEGRFIENVGF